MGRNLNTTLKDFLLGNTGDRSDAALGVVLANGTITLPSGLGWDQTNYPISFLHWDHAGFGVRKGRITGYSPWTTTSYLACRAGTQIYVATTGSDGGGDGSSGNPYRSVSKAVQIANAGGVPATIIVKAGEYTRSASNTFNATLPTVPISFIASGGLVIHGSYDKGYTWAADGTYAWIYSTARSAVYAVYDPSRKDRYGNDTILTKVTSTALCSRIPGSWYTDGTSVWVHSYDETQPSDTNVRVYVTTACMDFNFGSAPVDMFWDIETSSDGWDIRGGYMYNHCTGYGSASHIFAVRGMSCRYGQTTSNSFGFDNWWGISWYENCYSGKAALDSFNGHNNLNTKPTYFMILNCRGVDCGVYGSGSCNNSTCHENTIGISVACDWDYSQGGNVRNIGTTKWLDHGSIVQNDRGDVYVGGTIIPTEVQVDNTAQIWLSDTIIKPNTLGFSLNATAGTSIHLKGIPFYLAKYSNTTVGTIDTWVS